MREGGDGSQVVCYCYDDLIDDEICRLEISEEVSDISQVGANEDPTNGEFVVINTTTQATANTILLPTTPINETSNKSKQPPSIKRKSDNLSKLSSDNFQPKPLCQESFPTDLTRA